MPERVSVQWNRAAPGPRPTNPCFKLSPEVLVELPPADWGHGELLIYLPKRGWLIRRRYVDEWYVDIGNTEEVEPGRYVWNDLYLDVAVNEAGTVYRLLDANEFGQALRVGTISTDVAAFALESLHDLLTTIAKGTFPPAGVREAESFAASWVLPFGG